MFNKQVKSPLSIAASTALSVLVAFVSSASSDQNSFAM
jgi:hypothetical protein